MRRLLTIAFVAIAAIAYSGCQPAANTNTAPPTANANTGKPAAAAPTTDALVALDTKAWEAWKNKDGKFFEGFISDNFVGFGDDGKRPSRAEVIKMITENKCEVKSFALSDGHVTMVGADVAVLTSKATSDATCEGKKMPSPVTTATVFVRSGDTWKAAYHNEVAVMDPKDMKADDKKMPPPPAKDDKKADDMKAEDKKADDMKAETNSAAKPASDALTDAILAVEKSGWEAWKGRDAKKLEEITNRDIAFVDIFGKATFGQADVVKGWTEGKCEIKAVDVTDAKAMSISADAAILTYKGHAEGTCDGQPLMDLWGTTVAVKDGANWKAVYIFETPMR